MFGYIITTLFLLVKMGVGSEMEDLRTTVASLMESHVAQRDIITSLQNEIKILRDPPVSFTCASQNGFHSHGRVTYDSLYYSRTNALTEEGGMDLGSGVYTAPYPGTYTVTFSLYVRNDHGK